MSDSDVRIVIQRLKNAANGYAANNPARHSLLLAIAQIEVLHKDFERLDWILTPGNALGVIDVNSSKGPYTRICVRSEIDAAMTKPL